MPKIFTSIGVIDITVPSKRSSPKGEVYMVCPICTPGRKPEHKNEEKFAINVITKEWRCNHCNEGGLLHDEAFIQNMKIKPVTRKINAISMTDRFVQWFWEKRKISKMTLEHFHITLSMETLLQIRAGEQNKDMIGKYATRKCINFKYFKDNFLVNVKFRDADKNFKLISGADIILYNIDSLKGEKTAVIVEGEIDCMSYHEAGMKSVVSVPNGAQITKEERENYEKTGKLVIKSQQNLDYLDKCIESFEGKETIYIATDDDPAGIKLREELSRRLGKDRCKYIRCSRWMKGDGSPCKDPNDILVSLGKENLLATLEYAESYPVEGVSIALDYWSELEREYDEGRERAVPTGYRCLNPHWGWVKGWTTGINGYPGIGKSTFAFNMIAISIVKYSWRWGLYCPENYPPKNIVNIICEIIAGKTMDPRYEDRMTKSQYEGIIKRYINNYIYFVDNELGFTPQQLRDKKRSMIKQHGIVGFLTDPWSNLIHRYGDREDQYLEKELTEEVRLSTRTGLINLICVHPPTPPREKDKKYTAPSIFEITGGKIWAAKMYSVICVHQQDMNDYENTVLEIHVQKNKEQKIAGLPTSRNNPVLMEFTRKSGRFLERESDDELSPYNYFPISNGFSKDTTDIEGF